LEMRLEKKALDKLFRRRDRIEIPDFQRGEVWDTPKKQAFLDTIQKNWFVPVIFLREIDEQHFECIDGQQRLNAIFGFYNNKFPLSRKYGKYGGNFYKDLPDRIKDLFDDYELHIVEIKDPEEGEVEELFQRLQLGVPLNAGEKLNALVGGMRDFALELSSHKFMKSKISVRNYRFAHLSICSQICLLEIEGVSDAKFKNLSKFFKDEIAFSENSQEARKILKVFDLLNRIFPNRVSALSNRASVVSIYLLVSDLLRKTSLKGKEAQLRKFYIDFLDKLSAEVEKGPLAKDTELIIYQSAVNQAADSKESIQIRHDVLMKRLAEFDTDFVQYTEKDAIMDRLTALESENEIFNLSDDIFESIGEINAICVSKSSGDMFKVTNKAFKRISDVEKAVVTKEDFGDFVDALYEIVYEGSGSLNRIPEKFKNEDSILFVIKFIRTDIRHDLEHGDQKEVARKKQRLVGIYQSYTNKTSLDSLRENELRQLQIKMLRNLSSFLVELKKYCVENMGKTSNNDGS